MMKNTIVDQIDFIDSSETVDEALRCVNCANEQINDLNVTVRRARVETVVQRFHGYKLTAIKLADNVFMSAYPFFTKLKVFIEDVDYRVIDMMSISLLPGLNTLVFHSVSQIEVINVCTGQRVFIKNRFDDRDTVIEVN